MKVNKLHELHEAATNKLNEDTVKQNGKWVNKGKEGTHGKFRTKKAADAQRKAMFANGYKEGLCEGAISGTQRDFTYEQLADWEKELYSELNKNDIYPEDGTFYKSPDKLVDLELTLYIEGDWKHDHQFVEDVVEEFCEKHNMYIVKHSQQTIGYSDSDWYKAEHKWFIEMDEDGKTNETVATFRKMFAPINESANYEYINLGYFNKVKYSATEYDDGRIFITSHHPYDDSEYHWAMSKDGGNKFIIYINSPGQKVEIFESNPGAEYFDVVERLSELDKKSNIRPRMVHEDWLDDLDDSELDADIENAKLTTQPEQEFSSADTSQNQLASVFKQVDKRGEFVPETINLDYGGGRYDQGTDFMSKRGIKNLVYDAFNRNAAHNRRVENYINRNGGADTSTCANVLNVIKEPAIRHSVIQNIYDLLKPNGTAYFTTYEGNKSGKGDTSIKRQGIATSYQNHRDTKTYIEEIEDVFGKGNVSIKNKVITAVKR